MAGVAARKHLCVCFRKLRAVFLADGLMYLLQSRFLDGVEDVCESDVLALWVFAHGDDAYGPTQVRTGLGPVKLRQRPVLLLGGKPEIGEAASFSKSSTGDSLMPVVPSDHGFGKV